jgi:putative transposase
MPRRARNPADNQVYHVLNRGNCRMNLFDKEQDFAAFVALLEEARRRFPSVRILGYCLMHNHWHLVLWPRVGTDLSRFMGWLCTTHVRRWREHRGNVGEGHLYQGRFKSFVVQPDDLHVLLVLRYVEGNPLRAAMVKRAQDWPWSSLGNAPGARGARVQLTELPVDRPRDWEAVVNAIPSERELTALRTSVKRGRPLGDEKWTRRVAERLGLQSTLRDPWRPRKPPAPRTRQTHRKPPAGEK